MADTEIRCSLTIELAGAELELEGSYNSDGTLEVGVSESCLNKLEQGNGFDLGELGDGLTESLGIGSIVDPVENAFAAFKGTQGDRSSPRGAALYITKFRLKKSNTVTKLTVGLRIKFDGDNPPSLLGIELKSLGVEVSVSKEADEKESQQ